MECDGDQDGIKIEIRITITIGLGRGGGEWMTGVLELGVERIYEW